MMREPKFWESKNILAILLLPLSFIYLILILINWLIYIFKSKTKSNIPIICIGGLTMGGAGKTPIAILVGKIAKSMDIEFVYLTRGYKGSVQEAIKINHHVHNAKEVGDEALLLSRYGDVVKASNRAQGIEIIENDKKNYQLIIMDDGFHNPSIEKDYNVISINQNILIGNGWLFPAGSLKAPLFLIKDKINMLSFVGSKNLKASTQLFYNLDIEDQNVEIIHPSYKLDLSHPIQKSSKIFIFCAIAYPKRFEHLLSENGYKVAGHLYYPDHHFFSGVDYDKIYEKFKKSDADYLVTTSKDYMRIDKSECFYMDEILIADLIFELQDNDKAKIKNKLVEIVISRGVK